ncbi:acetate--CoA ligase family protein [Desulfonatronovibrio hydrogenovorans]|uniref:acetate--CoA ligase family protein n=1 Tax=Desulfonatronovibrio hydrogenovorans TaxID=53245 RepID=UPI00048D7533|nr:acetate--CoA ligase [Desulfonatronovibrio hydrogenovorans]
MTEKQLHALFNPQSVAVIGASSSPGKIGYSILENMIEAGFKGDIYPVNPKAESILDLKVVNQIEDLPDNLDLAVITIPRKLVVDSLDLLGGKKTAAAIVITAGFKEVGGKGYYLEQELINTARKHDMALLGPNCLGMINTHGLVNASFAAGKPDPGNIAFFSQSGALCVAILDWALGENIGFSKFVSLGNKAVLDEADMISYLGQDSKTDVILGYIENVSNGEKFVKEAMNHSNEKPIIIIKSGTTSAGAKAASSHTGAIAGSDQAYTSAFQKSGIIRAHDVETLFNLAQAFSTQPLPKGPSLAIVTNSGGPGIMAADACEKSSLSMARISSATIGQMQEFLPSYASLYNPIDIIGDAGAQRYLKTIDSVIKDGNVNSLLVLLTPTSTAAAEIEDICKGIVEVSRNTDKPIFACFMGKKIISRGRKILMDGKVPCYSFPEPAISCIEQMYKHYQWKNNPCPLPSPVNRDRGRAALIIDRVKKSGQGEIVEFQAQEILQAYNLPVPKTALARSSHDAVEIAQRFGYPVVLKIASPNISHKTDVDGVKLGLSGPDQVRKTFLDITGRTSRMRPDAHIAGCLVQEMAPKNCKEVIVGFKRDDQFGPLIMFGLGGIYVEVLKDISFRLGPVTREEARKMIREIKSYMLLKGFRGDLPIDFNAIEEIILTMSQLAHDFPEIYEAEFNPILVNSHQAMVADVRMTLG